MKAAKFLVFLVALGFSFMLWAEDAPRTAKVVELQGDVQVKLDKAGAWQPATVGLTLGQGAIIKTGAKASAVLDVDSGKTATLEVSPASQLMLAELMGDEAKNTATTLLDLSLGKILVRAKKLHTAESKFEVKTPTSVVGIRGTVFSVQVDSVDGQP